MHVRSVRLSQFRAHEDSRVSFGSGVTLLYGPNGAGKTNVLEALHYCCLARSFITTSDQYALRRGAEHMEVEADVSFRTRSDATVRFVLVPQEGKRVLVNGSHLERLVDVVGRFPVVAISPDDHRITDGGPDERRRFLDMILCQEKPRYLEALVRYRRVLRQRNEVLARSRSMPGSTLDSLLAPWDAELVLQGSRLTWYRMQFLGRFDPYLDEAFGRIESVAERPRIAYRGFARLEASAGEDEIADLFQEMLEERGPAERERGLTLVGPHRDELVLRLNDLEVRRYASHGQHRTFVLALRLAQYFYLRDTTGETPLLLMDDVFDNLDPDRIRIFAGLLTSEDAGQAIVTAARGDIFGEAVRFDGDAHRAIRIEEGSPVEWSTTS
jgi:DNA replication and repair protein RecF